MYLVFHTYNKLLCGLKYCLQEFRSDIQVVVSVNGLTGSTPDDRVSNK